MSFIESLKDDKPFDDFARNDTLFRVQEAVKKGYNEQAMII